jgi:hypothetical protein
VAVRMLCTDCFRVAVPDTVLEGSDLVELLAWAGLGVPGFLYCWWRHLARIKVCPHCSSPELVREARVTALRRPSDALPAGDTRIRSLSGSVRWPLALRTPRARLRAGGVAVLLLSLALIAWLLAALEIAVPGAAQEIMRGSSLLGLACLAHQIVRVSRMRAALPGYQAWDEQGRPLRIERV